MLETAIKGITYKNEARKSRRISEADSLEIKRVSKTTVKYHLDKRVFEK